MQQAERAGQLAETQQRLLLRLGTTLTQLEPLDLVYHVQPVVHSVVTATASHTASQY